MAEEPQHSDLLALKRSAVRRWVLLAVGGLVLVVGSAAGTVSISLLTLFSGLSVFGTINFTLGRLPRLGLHGGWLLHLSAGLDLTISGLLVFLYGPGGLILVFLVTAIPYSHLYGPALWGLLALGTGICYLAAASLHEVVFEELSFSAVLQNVSPFVEAVLLTLVTLGLGNTWRTLLGRLVVTRSILGLVEAGSLDERVPEDQADDLGMIGQSVNRVLDHVAEAATALLSEADQVENAAAQLGRSTQSLVESSRAITGTVAQTAEDMGRRAASVEEDLANASDLARTADAMTARAERVLADGSALTGAASKGSEQVLQASEELLTFSDDVRGTAAAVSHLSGSSKRIGEFALTISKIARQTHILALNAAIEAARAAEHGHGFVVVAEQVRTLAGEAGRSARDVSEVVAELREGIEKVAAAISSGEERIRQVTRAAGEARGTLDGLGPGLSSALELASETASLSKSQAARITSLHDSISALSAQQDHWAHGVEEIEGAVRRQTDALEDLSDAGQKLTQLTQQLRATTARVRETTHTGD